MRILFICPSFPSRFHRIRTLNIIKYLSRLHDIYLVFLTCEKNYNDHELVNYCKRIKIIYQSRFRSLLNCVFFLISLIPLEVAYCRNKKMNNAISALLQEENIDLIYIKRLRSAQFVDHALKTATIIDATDAMSLYYKRTAQNAPWHQKPLFFEEWMKYYYYEKRMLNKFRNWVLCSEIDLEYLKQSAPVETNLFFIPNGVDTDYYRMSAPKPEKETILFSGLMDKFVNIEAAQYFVNEILPNILKKFPNVTVYVTGPRPTRAAKMLSSKNVIVTGEVPDLRKYISKCEIIVAPIKTGVGTRNKILQAWAMGKPVVSTSLGAEGLDTRNGENIILADDAEGFANAVVGLMQNDSLKKKISAGGLETARTKYSMDKIAESLNSVLEEVVKK